MKVVLFCGGLGTRLREHSDTIPKPLVNIGYRPILWHLMRYYAHFGHRDFILCLGYRGDMIREYFLNYNEAMSNDFTWRDGGRTVELHSQRRRRTGTSPSSTPACTATSASGCCASRNYLGENAEFLANYADGLCDVPLPTDDRRLPRQAGGRKFRRGAQSAELPRRADPRGRHRDLTGRGAGRQHMRINGGFFVLRQEIFDYHPRGRGARRAAVRAADRGAAELRPYRWDGFWQCMDTFKDKITYDRMEARGDCPWKVWRDTG